MNLIKKVYQKNEEVIRYLIVGVCTTIISLLVKYLLLFTILNPKEALELQIAVVTSWIISVLFAYITNKIFVFKSKENKIIKEIFLFFSSRIVTLLMESFIMWFFVTLLKLNSNIFIKILRLIWLKLFAQLIVIVGNYILSKCFVFTRKK